jgi:hypothetical protein
MAKLPPWLTRLPGVRRGPPPAPLTEAENKARAIRHCRRVLWFVVALCLAEIPLRYYEFTVLAFLPESLAGWTPPLFTLVLVATFVYALYLAVRCIRLPRLQGAYPLLVLLLAHLPFGDVRPDETNRHTYHDRFRVEREAVVQAFCDKRLSLPPQETKHYYVLPRELRHLSVVGNGAYLKCDWNRNTAVFATRHGFLGYWEGLVYSSDGAYPDDDAFEKPIQVERLGQRWFYVSM